jgi:hypothetical protein
VPCRSSSAAPSIRRTAIRACAASASLAIAAAMKGQAKSRFAAVTAAALRAVQS